MSIPSILSTNIIIPNFNDTDNDTDNQYNNNISIVSQQSIIINNNNKEIQTDPLVTKSIDIQAIINRKTKNVYNFYLLFNLLFIIDTS